MAQQALQLLLPTTVDLVFMSSAALPHPLLRLLLRGHPLNNNGNSNTMQLLWRVFPLVAAAAVQACSAVQPLVAETTAMVVPHLLEI
jgi:hypothetical protein